MIMKNLNIFLFVAFILTFNSAKTQIEQSLNETHYSFLIQDSPAQLFTMRQVNQSYLSGYRLFSRGLYAATERDWLADIIQVGFQSLFLMPLTHEEGHRSVLTALNIGSVSQPYFNRHGAAYVKGVTDKTLNDLRKTDFPNYIRLHTAGLESDYMLTRRLEATGSFGEDEFRHYKWEYWMRKLGILQYYVTGLFRFDIGLEEEEIDLERDIVGYDTYSAARHLHRPEMAFQRYTRYDELTRDERAFVNRMGYRSLLNLLNPLLLGKGGFSVGKTTNINLGMGYTMAPFGDFIDENLWIKHKKLKLSIYARQFQNMEHWFHGFGASLVNYPVTRLFEAGISGHFWHQPDQLQFNTSESFTGGAIDLDLRFFFFKRSNTRLRGVSVDLGILYKTRGFLPEELNLDEHLGIRSGVTIIL